MSVIVCMLGQHFVDSDFEEIEEHEGELVCQACADEAREEVEDERD